jgi:PAS domain S-box-containing protein
VSQAKILVVEDETIVAMDLKRALEGFGYHVPGMAISGSEALEMARETRPDIILMDINLDGQMDGVEVAHRLRDSMDVPVVFLTAYSNDTTLERAKTAQPFGFLLKPYQERELRSAVEVALYKHGMEKKLRRRESWLDAILRGMADCVIATDAAGFVTFVNSQAEALLGRKLEALRGRTLARALRLVDDGGEPVLLDATAIDGGVRGPTSAILVDAAGREVPVDFSLTRLQDDKRRPEGMVVVFRDLSLRLKAEQAEALRQSEERLRAFIDGASDMIVVFDAQLKITFTSPSVERILGYTPEETLNTSLLDYVDPEDHGMLKEALEDRGVDSNQQLAREYRARHRDGSLVILETVSTNLTDHQLVQGVVVNARDVTERRRMEAALIQSEQDYRGLFENASDCIVIFEPEDERVLEVNDRACEVYGLDRSEFIGRSLKEFSEDVGRGRDHIEATLATNSVYRFETIQYRRDGSPLNLEITASVVDYQGGRAIYSIGRDVTGRKHAEQALLRANRRLEILNVVWREIAAGSSPRVVVEAALTKMIELLPCDFASVVLDDPQGQGSKVYVAVGDPKLGPSGGVKLSITTASGCCPAEEDGLKHCPDLGDEGSGCPLRRKHAGDSAACVCAALRAEGVPAGQLHLVSAHPGSFETETIDVAREVAGVIVVALHQARLREELAEQEQRLQALVENLPEGVVCLDEEFRVTLANPTGSRLLRVISDAGIGDVVRELAGRPVAEVTRSAAAGRDQAMTLETEDHRSFELGVVDLAEDQPGVGGHIIVIRELTKELEARKRLEQQERLASVGQLAAGIAHDFNNMLQAISGFAQLIQTDGRLPAGVIEKARGISQQGMRGAGLIRQILDFSRTSVSERSPLRLELIIKETMKMLERIISEEVRVRTEIRPGEYVVVADPTQIQQVLMNLAVNARDAMPGGGELTISLDRVVFADEEPRPFPQMAAGDWLRLTVRDDGAGMSAETAARVFEPFFTTKEPGEGTGLGLAQVYGIVKQHEGFIDLETELGVGTAILIYLPIARIEAERDTVDDATPEKIGEGELVLLVEDEAPVREVIHGMLEVLGFDVVTASSGSEALQVYERFQSEIELIVSDVVLPGIGGVEFSKEVQEMSPELPVILMSGYPLGDDAHSTLSSGMTDWIAKPFSAEQLAAIITRVLHPT